MNEFEEIWDPTMDYEYVGISPFQRPATVIWRALWYLIGVAFLIYLSCTPC